MEETTVIREVGDRKVAGTLLREARLVAGIPQRELARLAGVSASEVSDIERGQRQPSLPVLIRLVRACGRSLDFRIAEPRRLETDRALPGRPGSDRLPDEVRNLFWTGSDTDVDSLSLPGNERYIARRILIEGEHDVKALAWAAANLSVDALRYALDDVDVSEGTRAMFRAVVKARRRTGDAA